MLLRFQKGLARFTAVLLVAPAAAITSGPGFADCSVGPPGKNYEFVNGQWFDGHDFQRKVLYSVGGVDRFDNVRDIRLRFKQGEFISVSP